MVNKINVFIDLVTVVGLDELEATKRELLRLLLQKVWKYLADSAWEYDHEGLLETHILRQS